MPAAFTLMSAHERTRATPWSQISDIVAPMNFTWGVSLAFVFSVALKIARDAIFTVPHTHFSILDLSEGIGGY